MNSLITSKTTTNWPNLFIVIGVLIGALLLGSFASLPLLILLGAILGAIVVFRQPFITLFGIVFLALLIPFKVPTGTEVILNLVTLLVPTVIGLWVLTMIRQKQIGLMPSPVNKPLFLFLATGLASLLIGNALWDTAVPRSGNFWLVQLAQWAIFAFSAGAFWLTAHLIKNEQQLAWLTFFFLAVVSGFAILHLIPSLNTLAFSVTTVAFIRAPLWVLLTGLAGGQLLFNRQLGPAGRLFLLAILGEVVVYSFGVQQEAASNWVGVLATVGVLGWLRWPQLRGPAVLLLIVLIAIGFLLPAVYNFAGGDEEWFNSGGARLALISRVLELTLTHNPLTGLGPAAYRPYGFTQPLIYAHIVWIHPLISSHNNYVDIFAHTGLIGLFLFGWFIVEAARLGIRLHYETQTGFLAGYVNGLLAIGAGCLVIMLLADWILPFVYNISFDGFQASILVWLFWGGLICVQQLIPDDVTPK